MFHLFSCIIKLKLDFKYSFNLKIQSFTHLKTIFIYLFINVFQLGAIKKITIN